MLTDSMSRSFVVIFAFISVWVDGQATTSLPATAATSASLTTVSGVGVSYATVGVSTTFSIVARDVYGRLQLLTSDTFTVTFADGPASVTAAVVSAGAGIWTATYTVPTAGRGTYSVTVRVNGEPISGSPFTLTAVTAVETNALTSLTFGAGLLGAEAGQPGRLVVRGRNAAGLNLTTGGASFYAKLYHYDTQATSSFAAVDKGDGTYEIGYNATAAGRYSLAVYSSNVPTSQSPWNITVTPGPASFRSRRTTDVVDSLRVAGELWGFLIEQRDVFGNVAASLTTVFTVNLTFPDTAPAHQRNTTFNGVYPAQANVPDGRYAAFVQVTAPGTYTVAVYVHPANQGPQRIENGLFNLTLAPAPPPVVEVVEMSAIAAEIVVTFDRPTSAPALACEAMLSAGTRSLGVGAVCSWNTAKDKLTVRLGSGATVGAGDNITFIGTIDAQDKNSHFVAGSYKIVSLANAQLVAPAQLNSCGASALLLNAAASSGGGGWPLNFSWAVAPADSPTLAQLVAAATGSTLSVPAGNLTNGETYTFSVTVTNVYGYSSTATRDVTKIDDTQRPTVSIVNPTPVVSFAYKEVTLQGSVSFSPCAVERQLAFNWTCSPALRPGVRLGTDGRDLYLPAYALEADTTYTFTLQASLLAPPYASSSASIAVSVVRSAPQARIAGGSSRQVAVTDTARLDASVSVDRDVGNSTAALAFAWACGDLANGGAACLNASSGLPLVLPPTAVVTLSPNSLVTARSYRFTVTVSKGALAGVDAVTLFVTTGTPPSVSIVPLATGAVNPSAKLVLECNATSHLAVTTVSYGWSVTSAPSPLPLDASTLQSPSTSRLLVVSPNVLQPGTQYTFRCTATDADNVQGYAEVSFAVNAPPSQGGLQVSPTAGTAVDTGFTLRADGWADDPADYPLTYRFSYYVDTGSISALLGADESFLGAAALQNSLFPARVGQLNTTSNVTFVVRVTDALGAVATATRTVVVEPAVVSDVSAFASDYLDSTVADARANGNLDEMSAGVALIASVLNSRPDSLDSDERRELQRALLSVLQQAAGNVSRLPGDVAQLQISAVRGIVASGVDDSDDQRGAMQQVRQLLQSADGSSDAVSRGVGGVLDGVIRSLLANGSVPVEVAEGVYTTAEALFAAQLEGQVCGEDAAVLSAQQLQMVTQRSALVAGSPLSLGDGGLVVFGSVGSAPSADGCFAVQGLVVGVDLNPAQSSSSRKRDASAASASDYVGSVLSVNVSPNTVTSVNISFVLSPEDFALVSNTATSDAVCRYREAVTDDWVTDASCALVALESATRRVVCHCTHLTDFSVKPVKKAPKVDVKEAPIEDTSLSAQDLILIVVPVGCAIIVIIVATVAAIAYMQRMRQRMVMPAIDDGIDAPADEEMKDKPQTTATKGKQGEASDINLTHDV